MALKLLSLGAMLASLLLSVPAFAQSTHGNAAVTPGNLTQVTASATGTTGAVSASLPALSGHSDYLCGVSVTSAGTASPAAVTVTITGVVSGTLNFIYYPSTTGSQLLQNFSPCLISSALATAITVSVPALGGGAVVAVTANGYQ